MTFIRSLIAASALAAAVGAQAAPVQLVTNGEFEVPAISPNSWTCTGVAGWTSTAGCLEIWGATYNPEGTLAANGTDGLAHGQHHELTFLTDTEFTTQALAISGNGKVDFSFDGWRRDASAISWSISGSLSGMLASGVLNLNDDAWHSAGASNLWVSAGEVLTLRFQSVGVRGVLCGGSPGCGAHIDQVSVLYTVPEPSTFGLLGLALVGAGVATRRRRA